MVITTIIIVIILLFNIRSSFYFSNNYLEIKGKIKYLAQTAFTAQIIDQFKLNSGFFIANYIIIDREIFGYYTFALIIVQGLNIISTSVQQFIIPKMSELSRDIPSFFQKYKKFEYRFITISMIIFLLAELFLPFLIETVFGTKYSKSIPLLRIMLVGWGIQSFYALKGVSFLSLGKMKYVSHYSFFIFTISVPLMLWLNIIYGVKGAAFAFVLQNVISFFVISFFVKKLKATE
jgi:O-antigen/teichoic acid export membrane protein